MRLERPFDPYRQREQRPETDFASHMAEVAERLLGEPPKRRRGGDEWRYGARESLRVNVDAGTWYDYEAGEGGGVLALIRRELSTDTAGAIAYLRLPADDRPAPAKSPAAEPKPEPKPSRHAELWAAGVAADDTPALRYLVGRLAWPPTRSEAPAGVRWCAASDWPASVPAPPRGAAGAILYAFRADGALRAVQYEALDRSGRRIRPRWRRCAGAKSGAYFAVGEGRLVVALEGEVSAIAASVLRPDAECRAYGGAAGLAEADIPAGRPAVVDADGDSAGAAAARRLLARHPRLRLAVRDEGDAADELAGMVRAAAAMLGGDYAAAWVAVLNECWPDFDS